MELLARWLTHDLVFVGSITAIAFFPKDLSPRLPIVTINVKGLLASQVLPSRGEEPLIITERTAKQRVLAV